MPAFKDLYDLVKKMMEEEENEFKNMEAEIEKEFNEPLYTYYETDKEIYYIVDVPHLESQTLYIKMINNKLELKCKDKRGKCYHLELPVNNVEKYDVDVVRSKGFIKIILRKKSA
ncbi:hypothetical protein [Acidianus sp. HS-5]|uniref:hypothetical protein n=1 Tax=Acidianus sp. HS-5 TaxID=2886040 RepID=UPI001F392A47|nr:hypothetical protein [Acidianus sp. HS-5]BDC19844.1 hypothetical protein HS5_27340 [Acidianus sp. HS-5]